MAGHGLAVTELKMLVLVGIPGMQAKCTSFRAASIAHPHPVSQSCFHCCLLAGSGKSTLSDYLASVGECKESSQSM
jgi:hypothetical protein